MPFRPAEHGVPRLADFMRGYHTYVTGLTHDERRLPRHGASAPPVDP